MRANEELVSAYEGLDPRARRDVRVELGFLPFPADIALLSAMQLNEAALHGRDVRVAFDPLAAWRTRKRTSPSSRSPGSSTCCSASRPSRPPSMARRQRCAWIPPTRTVPSAWSWDPPSVSVTPDKPDGILAGPAEAFVRLLAGRLRAANTPGGVTLTGRSAAAITEWFGSRSGHQHELSCGAITFAV